MGTRSYLDSGSVQSAYLGLPKYSKFNEHNMHTRLGRISYLNSGVHKCSFLTKENLGLPTSIPKVILYDACMGRMSYLELWFIKSTWLIKEYLSLLKYSWHAYNNLPLPGFVLAFLSRMHL